MRRAVRSNFQFTQSPALNGIYKVPLVTTLPKGTSVQALSTLGYSPKSMGADYQGYRQETANIPSKSCKSIQTFPTPMDSQEPESQTPELPPTKYVAQLLLEHMQKSGRRDHIKEWLLDELESKGWKSRLFEKAAEIVNLSPENPDAEQEEGKEPGEAIAKARDIGGALMEVGHGKIAS